MVVTWDTNQINIIQIKQVSMLYGILILYHILFLSLFQVLDVIARCGKCVGALGLVGGQVRRIAHSWHGYPTLLWISLLWILSDLWWSPEEYPKKNSSLVTCSRLIAFWRIPHVFFYLPFHESIYTYKNAWMNALWIWERWWKSKTYVIDISLGIR